MNSWTTVCGLLLLSLCCLVAHEAEQCQCSEPHIETEDDGGSSVVEDTIWESSSLSASEQREHLLATTENKCSVSFFSEYRKLTSFNADVEHASEEDLRQMELVKQWLAECPFEQDFKNRLIRLGYENRKFLASFVECIKKGMKEAFITSGIRYGDPPDLYSEGVLAFLGQKKTFVRGREMESSDLGREFYHEIETPCRIVWHKLEPTAEIFRLFSDVRAHVFPEVDESLFSWANASLLCHTVAVTRRNQTINDLFAAYLTAFQAGRLPGDPRWEEVKAQFEQPDDEAVVLVASDDDECKWETLEKFHLIFNNTFSYRRLSEGDSLKKERMKFWSRCKETFEGEFRDAIAELGQRQAAEAVALVDAIYGGRPLDGYSYDYGSGAFQFMQQQDGAFKKWKKMTSEQFNEKFDQLVVSLATSVVGKLDPVSSKFSDYVTDYRDMAGAVDEDLRNWVYRVKKLKRVAFWKKDAHVAYLAASSIRCKLGNIVCGRST